MVTTNAYLKQERYVRVLLHSASRRTSVNTCVRGTSVPQVDLGPDRLLVLVLAVHQRQPLEPAGLFLQLWKVLQVL